MSGVRLARRAVIAQPTGPFDPLSLSPALWLKADAITGKVDTDAISSWADSSGNARNAAQATGAAQPTYRTAVQNGLPVVRFDGVNDLLTIAGFFPANTSGSNLAMFIACKLNNATVGELLSTRSGTSGWLWRATASNAGHGYFWIGGSSQSDTITTSAWHVLEVIRAGTSVQTGHDGTLVSATTFATYAASTASGLYIGAADNPPGTVNNPASVDIGEIFMVENTISAGNRASVEAYLKAKWATP